MSTVSARRAGRGLGVMLLVGIFVACAPDLKTDPPTGSGAAGGSGGSGGSGGTSSASGMGGTSVASSGSGAAGGSGGMGGAGGGMNANCPNVADTPSMVAVPSLGGKAYCIDSTEVTNAQYVAWLATNPDASMQKADCTWNTIFTTGIVGSADVPVVNVDWCDAYAFCTAKGKHLCGRIGGGPNDYASVNDPTQSEWYNVCSKGGTQLFPYGNTYEPMTCNGMDMDPDTDKLTPVGGIASCVGGHPGVFDMSGNAWEWENSCDLNSAATPEKQLCRRRGGSIYNDATNVECDTAVSLTRDMTNSNVGFRCCAAPIP